MGIQYVNSGGCKKCHRTFSSFVDDEFCDECRSSNMNENKMSKSSSFCCYLGWAIILWLAFMLVHSTYVLFNVNK